MEEWLMRLRSFCGQAEWPGMFKYMYVYEAGTLDCIARLFHSAFTRGIGRRSGNTTLVFGRQWLTDSVQYDGDTSRLEMT